MDISANFYFGWFLYDLICTLLLINMFKPINDKSRNILIVVYVLSSMSLALFGGAISPDFTSYREIVKEVAATADPFTHVESIYVDIIHKIGNNQFLFNAIIFIPQSIIIGIIIYELRICRPLLFLCTFSIFCLSSSIVGRYYLFVSVYTLGIILISRKKVVWGILLLTGSYFLHKAALIALPIGFLSLCKFNLSKRNCIIYTGIIILLLVIIRITIANMLEDLYLELGDIQGKDYLLRTEGANQGGSMWWQLIRIYQSTFKFIICLFVLVLLRSKYASLDFKSRIMYNLSMLTFVSAILVNSLGLPDDTIAGRTLTISSLPICYLLAQYSNTVLNKYSSFALWLGCTIYLILNNAYIVGVSHINLG